MSKIMNHRRIPTIVLSCLLLHHALYACPDTLRQRPWGERGNNRGVPVAHGIELFRYCDLPNGSAKRQAIVDFAYQHVLPMRRVEKAEVARTIGENNVTVNDLSSPEQRVNKSDIIALFRNDEVIAFIMFTYTGTNAITINHIRTRDDLRRHGNGALLWDNLLKILDTELDISQRRTIYHPIDTRRRPVVRFWEHRIRDLPKDVAIARDVGKQGDILLIYNPGQGCYQAPEAKNCSRLSGDFRQETLQDI